MPTTSSVVLQGGTAFKELLIITLESIGSSVNKQNKNFQLLF